MGSRPLRERKELLQTLLSEAGSPLHYSDHQIGRGRAFYDHACAIRVEGIVSKRIDALYAPGNRGLWLKVKCPTARSSWSSAGPIPRVRGHG